MKFRTLAMILTACGISTALDQSIADYQIKSNVDETDLIDLDEHGQLFIVQLRIPRLPPPSDQTGSGSEATLSTVEMTETFVDSQGRSLKYRYEIPEGIDPTTPQPVLIHFHGNNSGTQDQMLDWWFPVISHVAQEYDLMPVVVASPETRSPPQEDVRHWFEEDKLTIQEFLTQRLSTHFEVDPRRVYFDGASQGTCFIHDFMQEFGESYGGGFYGGCGCYNSPDPTWTPPQEFLEGMKVFVNSSTEDFLLETSYKGYAFYKYTIGVETRGDLDREGPHCSLNSSGRRMALDWFLGVTDIPEEPFHPHWTRVSPGEDIRGLAVEETGALFMVEQRPDSSGATLWLREPGENSWQEVAEFQGTVRDLEIIRNTLFVILDGEVLKSDDRGFTFSPVESSFFARRLNSFGDDILYHAEGSPSGWSLDLGESWNLFDPGLTTLHNRDSVSQIGDSLLIGLIDNKLHVGGASSGEFRPIPSPSPGLPFTSTWDGGNLWAAVRVDDDSFNYLLFQSPDLGENWEEIELPEPAKDHFLFGTRLSSLGTGKILISGWSESWMTIDNGRSWQRVLGLETASNGIVSARGDSVVFTDGQAAFELNAPVLVDSIFLDEFE